MSAPIVATAAFIRPPLIGSILVNLTGGTSFPIDVESLRGRFLTLQNSGVEDIGWLAGDLSVIADLSALSGATRCAVLGAGDSDGFAYPVHLSDNLSNLVTHIAVVSLAASTIRIWAS